MFTPPVVYANCPVCIVTVGGGLYLAKKLGIDDLLVSIWLSGLNSAIAYWIASNMKNKLLKNGFGWATVFFILTIGYLVYTNQIGHTGNSILGIDKIIVGMTLGFVVFVKAVFLDALLRKKNKGRVFFPYQKVIIPLLLLIITTAISMILISIYQT